MPEKTEGAWGSLRGHLADELNRQAYPVTQPAIVRHALRPDRHPALHRPAGDVERPDVRVPPRRLRLVRPEPCDQGVLPDADAHVAAQQEDQAAEHPPLLDALPPGEDAPDATRE